VAASSGKESAVGKRLAEAVAADVAEAFARFEAAHGDDTIVALALCSVDDAAPPYIMGGTTDDVGPIGGTDEDTWGSDPANWTWNDEGSRYRYESIIGEMLDNQPESFEEHGLDIFEGIVAGLKAFDATGQFKGKLPREQMLLLLWINDPSEHNQKGTKKWAGETNPKSVAKWFKAVYPY
jgi:hypothetical protein